MNDLLHFSVSAKDSGDSNQLAIVFVAMIHRLQTLNDAVCLVTYGRRSNEPTPTLDSAAILHQRKAYTGPASLPSSVALVCNLPLSFEAAIRIDAIRRYTDGSRSAHNTKANFHLAAFRL